MSKRVGALALPRCMDPLSVEYRQHRWVQWGDDPRFNRCMRCGSMRAENISDEARYAREIQPERRFGHHHQFEISRLDLRYEVCRCGKALPIEQPAKPQAEQQPAQIDLALTCVVHVRRDAFDIYVGRMMPRYPELKATGWGNPFTRYNLPKGYHSPVDAFRDWMVGKPALVDFEPHVRTRNLARLGELRGQVLGCWCAPKGGLPGNLYGETCHGEVLAWLADHPECVQAHPVNQAQVGGAA
jgi:hypothetical protein